MEETNIFLNRKIFEFKKIIGRVIKINKHQYANSGILFAITVSYSNFKKSFVI